MGFPSMNGLTAVSWTLTGVAILLTAGRYILRYRQMGRFFWDDVAHALALVFLIAFVVIFAAEFPTVFLVDSYVRGETSKPPAAKYSVFLKMQLAVSILFWLCVYAVKVAFLLLYRFLFGVSTRFKKAWWAVVVFTILTFWICIAGELTTCGSSRNLLKAAPAGMHNFVIVLEYSGVVHVVSDLVIMALPIHFLRYLQMRKGQKAGLACIFSIAVFVVTFDIIRTVNSIRGGPVGAQSALWCIVEATVAVIVSCLPIYRTLFTPRKQKKSSTYVDLTHQERLVKSQRSKQMNHIEGIGNKPSLESGNFYNGHAGSNIGGSSNISTAFTDQSDGLTLPEAALIIGVKQGYSVVRDG